MRQSGASQGVQPPWLLSAQGCSCPPFVMTNPATCRAALPPLRTLVHGMAAFAWHAQIGSTPLTHQAGQGGGCGPWISKLVAELSFMAPGAPLSSAWYLSKREKDSPCWNQGTRAVPEDINMTKAVYHRLHTLGRSCLLWSSTQPPKVALLLPLFYQWGSWGSERCGRSPKVTYTARNRGTGFDPGHALSALSCSPQ